MSRIIKELIIFVVLLLLLSLSIHMEQWLSDPIDHVSNLSHSQFGLLHPLYFTFGVYFVMSLIRLVIALIGRVFRRAD